MHCQRGARVDRRGAAGGLRRPCCRGLRFCGWSLLFRRRRLGPCCYGLRPWLRWCSGRLRFRGGHCRRVDRLGYRCVAADFCDRGARQFADFCRCVFGGGPAQSRQRVSRRRADSIQGRDRVVAQHFLLAVEQYNQGGDRRRSGRPQVHQLETGLALGLGRLVRIAERADQGINLGRPGGN